ncbi:MAG: hypothetical protein OXI87_01705 [Albidovulum sp.]|nr:hypothetical protein [Albidovulum sp.]
MKILITTLLMILPIAAQAEMRLTVKISLDGPVITITGVTAEDVEEGRYERMLSKAVEEARSVFICELTNRCPQSAIANNENLPSWLRQD